MINTNVVHPCPHIVVKSDFFNQMIHSIATGKDMNSLLKLDSLNIQSIGRFLAKF
jgi:hypothetical protein